MSSNLKVLGACSSHYLQGRGHTVVAPQQVAQLVLKLNIAPTKCDRNIYKYLEFYLITHLLAY